MKVLDVAKLAMPNSTDEAREWAIWNRTAFPFDKSARHIYSHLRSWARAVEHDIQQCDFCNNKAQPGKYVCARCDRSLRTAAEGDRPIS